MAKRKEPPRVVTTTGIRATSLERLKKLGGQNRMAGVDFIDCLLDAWETLSVEQQVNVIRQLQDADAIAAK